MLVLYLLHVLAAVTFSAPVVVLGRNRAKWRLADLAALVVPFGVWLACILVDSTGKSLSNIGECFAISLAMPLAALGRVVTGPLKHQYIWSGALLAALCLVSVAVYCLTPSLPE
jgi:hypothetical protein